MGGNDAAAAAANTARIAVWWDMYDCPVPEGIDARRVRPSLEGAFKELLGYSGPVSITAYGDQKQTPEQLLRALSSTGVAVVHTRSGCTCAVMYKDMVAWREDNPPPAAKMMIISNQVLDVFDWDLSRLQQRTFYDLFLAYSVEPRAGLHVRTRKEWLWEKLLTTQQLNTSAAGESSSSSAKKFNCKSCSLDRRSLKSFKKHLSTKKHALQEILRPDDSVQLQSVTSKWGKNYAATPEFATAKIHVWWDMYYCPIPDDGYDARRIRPSLEGAFKELGYSGPVSITAYGDHEKTPQHHLQALSSTGIDLAHATLEVVNGRISDDIDAWEYNNPAPATMMIISDEADYAFSDFLPHLLQGNKYNLFLAYSFRPREMSVLVTSAEWLWDSLLAVSDTRRHVLLRKCSGSSIERVGESTGMFYCKVCFSDFKHLDQFMKHLSSKKHARIGKRIADNIEDSENLQLFWLERHHFPDSKRFKKAP